MDRLQDLSLGVLPIYTECRRLSHAIMPSSTQDRKSPSITKSEEAGSFGAGQGEKVDVAPVPVSEKSDAGSERANVGLHEFALAKASGLRVTPEESRR